MALAANAPNLALRCCSWPFIFFKIVWRFAPWIYIYLCGHLLREYIYIWIYIFVDICDVYIYLSGYIYIFMDVYIFVWIFETWLF